MPLSLCARISECVQRCVRFSPLPKRARHRHGGLPFASILLSTVCTACGAVAPAPVPPTAPPPPPPPAATVTVTPNSATPFPNQSVTFQAIVKNASKTAVIWQVNQMTGGNSTLGTIDPNGVYLAPNAVPGQQPLTVTAVLQSDSTKTGSASVTVQSLSAVTGSLLVSPAISSVTTSQSLQLQILTPGISNADVAWTASAGTITPAGIFTSPGAPGAYTIQASLPNATGFATVEVTDFPGTLTWRNDNSRSGVNSHEVLLVPGTGPGSVNSSTFGKLFFCPLDGFAFAQPLYVPNLLIPGIGTRNAIIVATENNSVIAFDADAVPCQQLWKTTIGPVGFQPIGAPNLQITNSDIAPLIGITGTPVIDLNKSELYVVAATQTATLNPTYSHWLYALDLASGLPILQPVGIADTVSTLPGVNFSSVLENQRAALLLNNGSLYIAFGSYGNQGNYHGWLIGMDSTSLQPTGVFQTTPNPSTQGGIWQSGGGPSADSSGNVFAATGEGTFDVSSGGKSYSDSFLRLGTAGGLSIADYFAPCDQSALNAAMQGVGAGAPVLLPDSAGSPAVPHLLIGGSKGGSLYVVNRDSMGQFQSAPCPDLAPRVQTVSAGNGAILSTPLFWNGAVYVAPGNGSLMAFPMSSGVLANAPLASQSPESLGPQGATPAISANGTNNAILWLIDASGALATPNAPAILRAYDPSNLSNEIYNSAMLPSRDTAGAAVKFTVPTVANGKVYVGTQSELDVYGLLQ